MTDYIGTLLHCLTTAVLGLVGLEWLAASFFLGREIAQAEYRYIEANGGSRSDCPWYCGLLPSAWTIKGLLDWVLPAIIAGIWTIIKLIGVEI